MGVSVLPPESRAACEWRVVDAPSCPIGWRVEIFGLRLCRGHATIAQSIHDTVVAEKMRKEAPMRGHRLRRYKAPSA